MQWHLHSSAAGCCLIAAALAALPGPVRAADASSWVSAEHAKLRLIAGAAAPEALRAGLEMELAEGWKTYWRYPGDSGIPPQFDFAGSQNVGNVKVLWPAPVRFADGGGYSIGYKDRVVFPLRVMAADPKQPVTLRLTLRYAVCANVCVPVQAQAELALDGTASRHEGRLAAAEARVPRPATVGSPAALAVTRVRREDGNPHPRIVVEVRAPKGAAVDLFAEGPTPAWALPLPKLRDGALSERRTFSFALDGAPADAKVSGAELILTLVGPSQAVEVKTRLD